MGLSKNDSAWKARDKAYKADQQPDLSRGRGLLTRADVRYLDELPQRRARFQAEEEERRRIMAPIVRGYRQALGLVKAA